MSSQPAERTTARYKPAWAIGIVVLSLELPVAVTCWSVLAEMRDKGIAGVPSKRMRLHFGTVRKAELWHSEIRLLSNALAPPEASRFLRLQSGDRRRN
jgi:hypothetical protein